MSKVLVTGGAGSMGRQLALALASDGHTVRVLDLPSCDYSALEADRSIEILKGSISDPDLLRQAVSHVETVIHLAALLPPVSERDRQLTMAVNLVGTELLLDALRSGVHAPHLIFSSSVCVYGDTSSAPPPVTVQRPTMPQDIYGESKASAEEAVRSSGLPYTILRISGVAVPAFLEPPPVWPFTEDQRIEYVCRDDVVRAMLNAAVRGPLNRTVSIAGGATWRMAGREYVAHFNEAMGLEASDARYASKAGSYDWYDTVESQALLAYQQTSFPRYLELLGEAIERALSQW